MEHSPEMQAQVAAQFPQQSEEIWALLDGFQADIGPEERERVLQAVLTLSGEDRAKFERYLKVAARDYREVLIRVAEAEPPPSED